MVLESQKKKQTMAEIFEFNYILDEQMKKSMSNNDKNTC